MIEIKNGDKVNKVEVFRTHLKERPQNTWRRELEKERKEMEKDWSQLATLTAEKKNWRHKA